MERLIPTFVSLGISFCIALAGWIIKNTIYKRIDINEEEVVKLKEKVNKIDKDSICHEDLSKLEDKVSQIDKDSIRHQDLKDIQKDIKDIRDCYIKKDDFIRSVDGIHSDIKNLENLIMELIRQGGKDE